MAAPTYAGCTNGCHVQVEYPEQWPSFFHDLVAILAEGPDAVDMFCRVLTAVDQDVVSREISRLLPHTC